MEWSRGDFIEGLTAKGWTSDALCQAIAWGNFSAGGPAYMVGPDKLYYAVVTDSESLLDGEYPIQNGNNGKPHGPVEIRAGKVITKHLPEWAQPGGKIP